MTTLPKASNQVRFLVIGLEDDCGDGDRAVGIQVMNTVAQWRLPAVKALSVRRLHPDLVKDLVATDYVVFVEACSAQNRSRTVQLDPIIVGYPIPRTLLAKGHSCIPLTLLNLTRHLYDRAPQAWLLQVPTESYELKEHQQLSATAQRGFDRAVQTIEQLLKTYQQPMWDCIAVGRSVYCEAA